MMLYIKLFIEFFLTGLFAVGGGMATIPFLEDMSTRTGWFTHAQLADMIAVSESTPGPIGVNMATYVGYLTGGIPGGIVATLGLVTPSCIVILIVAAFLKAFRDSKYVERVFYGIRPASTALIAAAGVSVLMLCIVDVDAFALSKKIFDLVDPKAIILFALIWIFTNPVKKTKKFHPLVFIAISAIIGLVFKF